MTRTDALPEARALRGKLLAAGVPEVSIELQQGRPASGDRWNNQFVVTDMAHHTASRYSPRNLTPCLALVKNGRSDLPGPLCNGYGGWDLCARIITLGYANHPGRGGPLTVPSGTKRPPSYTIPRDSARRYAFGWEFEGGISDNDWDRLLTNPRNNVTMTFREFMARCLNGTQAQYRLPLEAHTEHKTWAPTRKIDRLDYTKPRAQTEMTHWQTPTPPPRDPDYTHQVRIVTANIKNNPDMADPLVRADIAETAKLGGWICFQEIGETEDHRALLDELGPHWQIRFHHLAVPIAIRDWATINDQGRLKLHSGKAKVSPDRYLTWVDLETPGGFDPIVMNTHWVSGAWTVQPKAAADWRRAQWQLSWQKTRQKIEEFNQAGRTVLIGGDFNRAQVDKFSDRFRWLAQHGIDKIGISRPTSGPRMPVVVTGSRHVDLNSDHDALQARLSWP